MVGKGGVLAAIWLCRPAVQVPLHAFPISDPPGCASWRGVAGTVGGREHQPHCTCADGLWPHGCSPHYPPKPRRYRPVILPISPAFAGRTALHGLGLWNGGQPRTRTENLPIRSRALYPVELARPITQILGTSRPCTGSVCSGRVATGTHPRRRLQITCAML